MTTSPAPRRLPRAVLVLACVSLLGTILVATSTPTAVGAAASYDPVPGASTFGSSVYGQVVADGSGTFHSVVREDGVAQSIVYRQSVDGGRTWFVTYRFWGEAGGATRPQLAVDGDVVAVGYIGGFCTSPGVCGEAPYLAISTSGGSSFSGPIRTAENAFNQTVAVDGDRVWFAWGGRDGSNGDVAEIRGVNAADQSVFQRVTAAGYSPRVVAADGVGVITYVRQVIDPVEGRVLTPTARFIRGAAFAGQVDLGRVPVDVAAAGGSVHLLSRTARTFDVRTAIVWNGPGDATLGPPVVAITGDSASITARSGLVAVAAVESSSGFTSVARSEDGLAFSPPRVVARTNGSPHAVFAAAAERPYDRPIARFDWSIAPRYVDGDGDGIPDPANSATVPSDIDLDTVEVDLDGCTSRGGAGSTSITSYKWRIGATVLPATTCSTTASMANSVPQQVTLTVTDNLGRTTDRTSIVTPRDLLVVSIGDSVASGEGNPHLPISDPTDRLSETWEDGPCHRSHFAGPALAARQLEAADDRSAVTFVQLSCSGASVMDVPAEAGAAPSGPDDPDSGGLLDKYHGVEPGGAAARPSQLAQMEALLGGRTPDAVMVSIGANDVKFSSVVESCMLGACTVDGTKATLDARLGTLPARYAALAAELTRLHVVPASVHISEYFDVSTDQLGVPNLRCVAYERNGLLDLIASFGGLIGTIWRRYAELAAAGQGLLSDDEAIWARDYLMARINDGVRAGATASGWTYVGGIAAQYHRHGYCSSEPYVVDLLTSFKTQGDQFGAFHPNRPGHEVYGRQLGASLVSQLVLPPLADPALAPTEAAVGDLYVSTESYTEVTVASVLDTGSALIPQSQRRLDRLSTGEGMLGSAGRPAADPASAVAAWYQLDGPGMQGWRTLTAVVGMAENIAVHQVDIVQGPTGARLLAAGRDTAVVVRLDASIAGPVDVDIDVHVVDAHDEVVWEETLTKRVEPGVSNLVLVPTEPGTFRLADRRIYRATVTIDDPPAAVGSVPGDNTGASADFDSAPAAFTLRGLKVLAVPANVGDSSLSCDRVQRLMDNAAPRATAMMPVAAEIEPAVACWPRDQHPEIAPSEHGVTTELSRLDWVARMGGYDVVVAVVPPGWLKAALPGTLGIATLHGRGAIIDASGSRVVLAHEVTHNLGIDHVPESPTSGAWVSTGQHRSGGPYMAEYDDGAAWADPRTWDELANWLFLHATPTVPDPATEGVWVRGEVYQNAAGEWVYQSARWVSAQSGLVADPRVLDGLELARMQVRQLDAGGDEIATQPAPLGPTGGVFSAGAEPQPPIGFSFSALVDLDPATASIELVLDGTPVETRPVNVRPTVSVLAPIAGEEATRAGQLTVEWESTDPDDDPLTTDLFISPDGGTSWEPLAVDVGASPATVTVPVDLDGDQVKVRVAVSDGVRMAFADSAPFSVGGASFAIRDRVVFTRSEAQGSYYLDRTNNARLFTMDPGGSDEASVPLPEVHTWATSGSLGFSCGSDCIPGYHYPGWSADGSRIVFSSDLVDTRFGGRAIPGYLDDISQHLWSVAPDGSDLRRITQPRLRPADLSVYSDFSSENWCAHAYPTGDRIVWLGVGGNRPNTIWSAAMDGSDQQMLRYNQMHPSGDGSFTPEFSITDPATWPAKLGAGWGSDPGALFVNFSAPGNDADDGLSQNACPRVSPDGSTVAFIAMVMESVNGSTSNETYHRAVILMGIDGSDARIVTNKGESYASVDWADDDTLIISRRTQPTASTFSYSDVTYQPFSLELPSLTLTALGPAQPQTVGPGAMRVAPDGELYGMVRRFQPVNDSDMVVIDSGGGIEAVVKPGPGTRDVQFHWGRFTAASGPGETLVTPQPPSTPTAEGGGPYVATVDRPLQLSAGGTLVQDAADAVIAWDLDDDGAFDDATGPTPTVSFPSPGAVTIRVRITPAGGATATSEPSTVEVLPAADLPFEVDPEASGGIATPPRPVALRVEIPAGVTTPVRLGDPDGPIGDHVVTEVDPAALDVASGDGAPAGLPLPRTGPDGTVLVTPAAGFRGSTSLTYALADAPDEGAVVEVVVTGPAAPVVRPDAVTVTSGVETEVPVADLLANDTDPNPTSTPLRVVAAYGLDGGLVWLDPSEEHVVVLGGTAGASSFTYLVANDAGEVAPGRVDVTVRSAAGDPTTSTPAGPGDPGGTPPPVDDTMVSVRRLGGATRYDTAAAIAREHWELHGGSVGVLARGDDYADALSGANIEIGIPLLTAPSHLPDATRRAIADLGITAVTIVGGTSAVSADVVAELQAMGVEVTRIAGTDRYDTARRSYLERYGTERDLPAQVDGKRTVLIASGENFPDALAAAPLAMSADLPLLLTQRDRLPEETRSIFGTEQDPCPDGVCVEQVLLVGGSQAISPAVEAEIRALGVDVRRVAGADRQATAIALAELAMDELQPAWGIEHLNLARGDDFPDALAGGRLGGAERALTLLTANADTLGSAIEAFLRTHAGTITGFHVLGGEAAIADRVVQAARSASTPL